jgi:hypothetical protein
MIAVKNPLFKPGHVVATPRALDALEQAGQSVWEFLTRHLAGDWGEVDADDGKANDQSLKDGSRLLSAYRLNTGAKIWIITEVADDNGNREVTTALLPGEY